MPTTGKAKKRPTTAPAKRRGLRPFKKKTKKRTTSSSVKKKGAATARLAKKTKSAKKKKSVRSSVKRHPGQMNDRQWALQLEKERKWNEAAARASAKKKKKRPAWAKVPATQTKARAAKAKIRDEQKKRAASVLNEWLADDEKSAAQAKGKESAAARAKFRDEQKKRAASVLNSWWAGDDDSAAPRVSVSKKRKRKRPSTVKNKKTKRISDHVHRELERNEAAVAAAQGQKIGAEWADPDGFLDYMPEPKLLERPAPPEWHRQSAVLAKARAAKRRKARTELRRRLESAPPRRKRLRKWKEKKTKVVSKASLLNFKPKYPPLDLPHEEYIRRINEEFKQFKWVVPKLVNACSANPSTVLTLSKAQNFVRHFLTPNSPQKGMLLAVSTGGGKTCAGVAIADNFPRVIWVTQHVLMDKVWSAVFDNMCSLVYRRWNDGKIQVPQDRKAQVAGLRARGVHWIKPMTYRQFAGALRPGKPTALGEILIRSSPAGSVDPLAGAVVIIDEAQFLFNGKLPTNQQPNMTHVAAAFDHSYRVSKAKSCKVVAMSATPAGNPVHLFKLLNLMIPKDKFPTNPETILRDYESGGKMSASGARLLQKKTQGLVSYLNMMKDASQFAQVRRHEAYRVVVSELQTTAVKACQRKSIKKPGMCIQKKLNVAEWKATDSFDHPNFNGVALMQNMSAVSPKFLELFQRIKDLDTKDLFLFGHKHKHVIFSDVRYGFGAKFIASALVATRKYNMIVKAGPRALVIDPTIVQGKTNIAILTSAGLYKGSNGKRLQFTRAAASKIISREKGIFNKKSNRFGKECQILVLNDNYSAGIDIIDAKYIHVFNPQISPDNLTQIEGRGTRFCGTTGLPFKSGEGWKLEVYNYESRWASPLIRTEAGDGKTPFEFMKTKLITVTDVKMLQLNSQMHNVLYKNAIDAGLNRAINEGRR